VRCSARRTPSFHGAHIPGCAVSCASVAGSGVAGAVPGPAHRMPCARPDGGGCGHARIQRPRLAWRERTRDTRAFSGPASPGAAAAATHRLPPGARVAAVVPFAARDVVPVRPKRRRMRRRQQARPRESERPWHCRRALATHRSFAKPSCSSIGKGGSGASSSMRVRVSARPQRAQAQLSAARAQARGVQVRRSAEAQKRRRTGAQARGRRSGAARRRRGSSAE
jgi:hypothetical protein